VGMERVQGKGVRGALRGAAGSVEVLLILLNRRPADMHMAEPDVPQGISRLKCDCQITGVIIDHNSGAAVGAAPPTRSQLRHQRRTQLKSKPHYVDLLTKSAAKPAV
jgi:hypothetical protein